MMSVIFETDAWVALLELIVIGGLVTAIGCYIEWRDEGIKKEGLVVHDVCGGMNTDRLIYTHDGMRAWILEHVVDGYPDYVNALYECGFDPVEIIGDLEGVIDDDSMDEVVFTIKELFNCAGRE